LHNSDIVLQVLSEQWRKCLCAQPVVYGHWCAHSIVSLHPVKQPLDFFELPLRGFPH